MYAVLGMAFIPVAILRYRMAVSNAQRFLAMEVVHAQQASPQQNPAQDSAAGPPQDSAQTTNPSSAAQSDQNVAMIRDAIQQQSAAEDAIDQTPAPVQTVLRESFITAGSIVAGATAFVGLAEIALLVLILRV